MLFPSLADVAPRGLDVSRRYGLPFTGDKLSESESVAPS